MFLIQLASYLPIPSDPLAVLLAEMPDEGLTSSLAMWVKTSQSGPFLLKGYNPQVLNPEATTSL